MVFMAIDRQQQIGDQAGQNLNQHAVFTPGKQMVNVQMLFPPAEKRLNMPAKFVREHYLLRSQVETVGRNQVVHATGLETHNRTGVSVCFPLGTPRITLVSKEADEPAARGSSSMTVLCVFSLIRQIK